jgi:hypothetical protein
MKSPAERYTHSSAIIHNCQFITKSVAYSNYKEHKCEIVGTKNRFSDARAGWRRYYFYRKVDLTEMVSLSSFSRRKINYLEQQLFFNSFISNQNYSDSIS